MKYTELIFKKPGDAEEQDILIAELASAGFESFTEENDRLLAYIPQKDFSEKLLQENDYLKQHMKIQAVNTIEEQNWNAVWESNYEPVVIRNCGIRAPFHPENKELAYDIVIHPKMSFGTAHHETTALIIDILLDKDVRGKKVLDMGCGTGVLAILASMKGAAHITAIDNDEWAYTNALENCTLNNIENIRVEMGDERLLGAETFNLILANINKNILLGAIPIYAHVLEKGGEIIFSGFYNSDLEDIKNKAEADGLAYHFHKEKNNWVAASFIKK
jgi:ribosomal protein L11 methyltransferase